MSRLHSSFSLHLTSPFEASIIALSDGCVLRIGEPRAILPGISLFFSADRAEQAQRIADALNEVGGSVSASKSLAA